MAKPTFHIVTPRNFQAWSLGARAIAGGFRGAGGDAWRVANQHFFYETQRAVHVVSGDLKATGREEVDLVGVRVVASVEYGGPVPGSDREVVYAQYEIDRGGPHDYMGIGWEASQATFEAVFGQTWNRVVATWK